MNESGFAAGGSKPPASRSVGKPTKVGSDPTGKLRLRTPLHKKCCPVNASGEREENSVLGIGTLHLLGKNTNFYQARSYSLPTCSQVKTPFCSWTRPTPGNGK